MLALADRYDFHPNVVARSLAAGRTRVIGLVIPATVASLLADPYFPLLIQGISSACNAYDYSVTLWLSEPEHERKLIGEIVHSGMLDGVLMASIHTDDPLIPPLLKRGLPFILVGRRPRTSASATWMWTISMPRARPRPTWSGWATAGWRPSPGRGRTLFDLIETPGSQPRRVILPTELVIRASTGSGV